MKKVKKTLSLLLMAAIVTGMVAMIGNREISAATKPGKPEVKLSETGEYGEVLITIGKTENADGYRIFYKGQNDRSYIKLVELNQDGKKKRTYTAKNLESGVYSFRVRAYLKKSGKKVWGSFSKVVKIEVVDAATRAHDDRMHELAEELYPDLYPLVEDGKMGLTMDESSNIYYTFGSYDMVDSYGRYDEKKEPIEWEVLDYNEDEGKVLLISRYIVDKKLYNDTYTDVTWETCTLRSWLNEEFLYNAFNKEEQKLILKSDILNHDENEYKISGGNDTKDRVFILSYEEAKKYGLKRALLYGTEEGAKNYWLRTPGNTLKTTAYVSASGPRLGKFILSYKKDLNLELRLKEDAVAFGIVDGSEFEEGKGKYSYYTYFTFRGTTYVNDGDKTMNLSVAVEYVRPAIWVDLTQE